MELDEKVLKNNRFFAGYILDIMYPLLTTMLTFLVTIILMLLTCS